MIDPKQDGITHINVYSKGNTVLGRLLSNFAHTPVKTEDGKFESIEGYWYWLGTRDDRLRKLYGYKAKQLGRELSDKVDKIDGKEFRRKIRKAVRRKITKTDKIIDFIKKTKKLPLMHYYVYSGKAVEPKGNEWLLKHLEKMLDRVRSE